MTACTSHTAVVRAQPLPAPFPLHVDPGRESRDAKDAGSSRDVRARMTRRGMWLLYTHYDGEQAPVSARVLHSERTYKVGRKVDAVDLHVPIARISRLAGTLHVGAVAPTDVHRAQKRADLTWTMQKNSKSGSLVEGFRGRNRVERRIRPETPVELGDASRICLVSGLYADVRWLPVILCCPSHLHKDDMIRVAARVGVHIVPTLCEATHLVVPFARPNKTQVLALVRGVPIVSESFLQAVFDAAHAPVWKMPDPADFVPSCDPSLAPESRVMSSQWTVSAARRHLYAGLQLSMWISHTTRRYSDMAELAEAAGATVHIHDVSQEPMADVIEVRRILAQYQPASDVFVVADHIPLVEEACRTLRLPFLPQGLSAITQGIIDVRSWRDMVPQVDDTQLTEDVTSWQDDEHGMNITDGSACGALDSVEPSSEPFVHPPVSVERPAPRHHARRSVLLDEILGVSSDPPSAKYRRLLDSSPAPHQEAVPPSSPMRCIERPSLMQVHVEPMSRGSTSTHDYKKFRRRPRHVPAHRVALFLDVDVHATD